MKILVLLQFPQQLEQYKCVLEKLDDAEITVLTDTTPAYSNKDRWHREGAWKNKIRIWKSPVFPHPWYYILARNIDEDRVFCWNDFQENELVKYHDILKEKIMKVGAFSFERWLEKRRSTPRREFCRKWDLDEDRPFVTYLSSSNSIAGDEVDGVTQFADYCMIKNIQVVVRAHPDKAEKLSKIPGTTCIPRAGENVTDEEAFQLAYDTYFHSSGLYTINTSAMIEAMLVGKPVFGMDTNKKDVTERCLHYQQLEPWLNGEGYKAIRKWLGIGDRLPSDIIVEEIKKLYN